MTEKMFHWIETELSRTHTHSFRSIIKHLMCSCDIPWSQELPQLVKSYDHTASIFRKESGQGDWCGGLELIFSLTCHCVSCEVITAGVYFGVSWLCFIVSLCCTIMFNCVTWTCIFFVFLPLQTPNCDTMKVAIVFVLLFATVLCRPVSRSSLSSQNLKINFAQLRIAFHFWRQFPSILEVVLVYVLRFFSSTCKYVCLLCRQERLLTVLRALRKWWVPGEREREREQERLRERERERENRERESTTLTDVGCVHRWENQHRQPSRNRQQWFLRPLQHLYRYNIH